MNALVDVKTLVDFTHIASRSATRGCTDMIITIKKTICHNQQKRRKKPKKNKLSPPKHFSNILCSLCSPSVGY